MNTITGIVATPCPSCGHCPTCGRSAQPFYPQPQPYWPVPNGPYWGIAPTYPTYSDQPYVVWSNTNKL